MTDAILEANEKPRVKFVVRDHGKIMETVNDLVTTEEACHFCGAAPIVVVYRNWEDKIVTACKEHEEIVLEMIERDK
jgi:hypothetical protein